MKKITFRALLIALICCFTTYQMTAQDGYTYTLAHQGGYDFTVQVVPNASANNFGTSVQSYGFTLIVPDGITITMTSSLGGAATPSFFDGTAIAQPTIDGYLVTETLGSPITLPAPSAATNSDVFGFTVNGTPTSGEISILENNSALATTITALKSFMQADMIDNGMAEFVNVVDPNAAAVSGMSSFMFSTLTVEDSILDEVTVYPNPTADQLFIGQASAQLNKIEVFDVNGRRVLEKTSQLENVDMSSYQSGVYFVKLYTENANKIMKIIRK